MNKIEECVTMFEYVYNTSRNFKKTPLELKALKVGFLSGISRSDDIEITDIKTIHDIIEEIIQLGFIQEEFK